MALPIGTPVHITNINPVRCKAFIKDLHNSGLCGFFDVKFEAPSNLYPVLPIKGHIGDFGDKLLFCVGKSHGVYYRFELRMALDLGYVIREIKEGYVFKRGFPLAKYSNSIIARKADAKARGIGVIAMLYKLLNNSLYGKFAINPVLTSRLINTSLLANLTHVISVTNIEGIDMCVVTEDTSSGIGRRKSTNVAISAAVTS
jgi:hypothetical protein